MKLKHHNSRILRNQATLMNNMYNLLLYDLFIILETMATFPVNDTFAINWSISTDGNATINVAYNS